ncbi:basic salivary proline-rich protein 2-like [Cygnus olor]|uniref:basic salivary proline-rich protein 2-like n=1 Tax=Cygnus olor TaxID=8869 RepID=UPI001ADE3CEA|nr:basic salivary proline-rich protein 2-like [Cygnus olor]
MSPPALRGSELPGPGPPGATTGVRPDPPAQGHPDRRAVTSRPLTHGADDATRGSPTAGTPPPHSPPALPPAPGGAGEGRGHAPHPRSRGLGTAVRARSPPGRLSGSRCFGTAGWGVGGSASVRPSVCLSIRPSLRGRRLVGVCVTDTAAGQPPSRGEPGGWEGGRRQRRRPPAAAAPSPSPAALPGGSNLSGLAAPPPSWRHQPK